MTGAADDAAVDRLTRTLLYAFATAGKVSFAYGFKRPPRLADLARIERHITTLVSGFVRDFGVKLPRKWLYLDPARMEHEDDGDNTVTITVDFGELVPGERPAEMVEAAKRLLDDASAVAEPTP